MDFHAVKLSRHIFLKNPVVSAPFPCFFKKYGNGGGEKQPPTPVFSGCDFSGRNTVCKPAKTLGAKVSLVLPSRPDWNGMAADFLHDFFPGHVWIVEKFFTESDRHFEVYSIGIQAIGRLLNNSFLHNAAGEVKGSMRELVAVKGGVDHLLGLTDGRENKAQER